MPFQIAFTPATNSKGQVKLTFDGHEFYTKETEVTDKTTGEITKETIEYIKLKFTCMDITRKNPRQMNIIGKPVVGDSTRIGVTLSAMGFVLGGSEVTEDDDGFSNVEVEADDDDFAVTSADDDSNAAVEEFLNGSKGKHYVAKLKKNDKGFWDIDVNTIETFVSKANK